MAGWRELASMTAGMTPDDPRLAPVLAALEACDNAFLANDWLGFQQAVARVRLAAQMEHER